MIESGNAPASAALAACVRWWDGGAALSGGWRLAAVQPHPVAAQAEPHGVSGRVCRVPAAVSASALLLNPQVCAAIAGDFNSDEANVFMSKLKQLPHQSFPPLLLSLLSLFLVMH
ncbi:unnamed protein product, partial [Closterium sp. Yama58-4]